MRSAAVRFSVFGLVVILASGWIFSGWPQIGNFPPKIERAEATPLSAFASSYSADGTLGAWTNPTYAYNDDGVQYATRAGTSKNTWYGNIFGFNLAAIPDGAIINSVTITAQWHNSGADAAGPEFFVGAKSGGAEVGVGTTDTSGQVADELVTYSPSGLTAADLKATGASGFWAILRFRRTDNTTHTASVDYVKIDVDYTPVSAPTTTLSAATNVQATTATLNGNITATGGANPTVTVFWGTTDGGQVDGNWANSSAPTSPAQPQGVAAFYTDVTNLASGTTIYFSAKAVNAGGTGWPAASLSFLTKPGPPTNVAATDGTATDKVTVTWTKSTGATDYHVWRDSTDLGSAGDVATFDDSGADAPTITPGSAVASDGTNLDYTALSLSGTSANNGTTHTYKVVASNATGNSVDSATDTGYRGVGSLTYQWQRSAADSDASYSNINGATTASYNDTGAPADGSGRYYKAILNATGASQQISAPDRGYRQVLSATISCSTNVASTAFGSLTSGSVSTASPNASTTISCANTTAGCTLYIKDAGGGGSPGLWSSAQSHLIPSPNAAFNATATLSAGTEGYGIQGAGTANGSGTLTISATYLQTGNVVGGLTLADQTLASSAADITGKEVVVTHKAAISGSTPAGNYADTITYSCLAN